MPVCDAFPSMKKNPYQIISIQMNFTRSQKWKWWCHQRAPFYIILYRLPQILLWTCTLRRIYALRAYVFDFLSDWDKIQNIKLLDIDRKFYNRPCNPFDIAKKHKPRNSLALYTQFIKLVLCVSVCESYTSVIVNCFVKKCQAFLQRKLRRTISYITRT